MIRRRMRSRWQRIEISVKYCSLLGIQHSRSTNASKERYHIPVPFLRENEMKIAASLVVLCLIGLGVAMGANYASKSSLNTESKVCACETCCPDGGCCCETGVCSCDDCQCDCCAEGATGCLAGCCTDKVATNPTDKPATCTKGCCME